MLSRPSTSFLQSTIRTISRSLSTTTSLHASKPTSSPPSTFTPPSRKKPTTFSRPSPPPLPPADQAEFDALLKAHQTVGATPLSAAPSGAVESALDTAQTGEHRDLRRKPKPEFEGDVNPKTGEWGGPKRDPFGAGTNDWQYGGRVTDF